MAGIILGTALALVLMHQGDAAAVREIEKIEHQLAATYQAGDCAAWGAFLAPDWRVTHVSAEVHTRAEALVTCAAARGAIAELNVSDLQVRIYGDTAVATGRTRASTKGSNTVTVTLRFTDVFVRQGGRWLVVASHATRVGG
jgi:ketosteroid isomerase-like protein